MGAEDIQKVEPPVVERGTLEGQKPNEVVAAAPKEKRDVDPAAVGKEFSGAGVKFDQLADVKKSRVDRTKKAIFDTTGIKITGVPPSREVGSIAAKEVVAPANQVTTNAKDHMDMILAQMEAIRVPADAKDTGKDIIAAGAVGVPRETTV